MIEKCSHKQYAILTALIVTWALWSFKILIWSELCWWVFIKQNSCCPIWKLTRRQEVGGDLNICVMNILPKVSSLPSLLAINLMKMEIQIFQTVTWSQVGHLVKGSCLGASNTMSAPCLLWCWYIFCSCRYIFYLSRDQKRPLRWDVTLLLVTTLKSLVSIGILIVERKSVSRKTSYKYALTLKIGVDWITTRQEKNVTNTKMVQFERKYPEIKKKTFFPLWLPSITLLLKWKLVELKRF